MMTMRSNNSAHMSPPDLALATSGVGRVPRDRSEAFLREAQRLSSTGSFSWRVRLDELTWSDQLYRIFEVDDGVDVTFALIDSRIHPDDLASVREMRDRARGEGGDIECEFRLLMSDRRVKHLHMVAHGNREHDGSLEYIGAIQDVTQRRVTEEALNKARTELVHVTRVMALGVLTASIAHEINQPLTGIITNATTCLRMLAADPPNVDGARETAQRTLRDGNRASDVVRRLRELFAWKDVTSTAVDLNDAVREVITLSLCELQRNEVVLRMDLGEDLPPVLGDRIQLQQVILNLVLNACEAMTCVENRSREMNVRTGREGERIWLSVRDCGPGVDSQAIARLFDPFYTTKADGMGIGLFVSRSIIERHNGSLLVAANEGSGVTFSFSLPCSRWRIPDDLVPGGRSEADKRRVKAHSNCCPPSMA